MSFVAEWISPGIAGQLSSGRIETWHLCLFGNLAKSGPTTRWCNATHFSWEFKVHPPKLPPQEIRPYQGTINHWFPLIRPYRCLFLGGVTLGGVPQIPMIFFHIFAPNFGENLTNIFSSGLKPTRQFFGREKDGGNGKMDGVINGV